MSATLILGECLEKMENLPAKSIDLFLCDLPYGCLIKGGGNQGTAAGCPWDKKLDLEKFWKQVKRLARNPHTPVLMFCTVKFGNELINSNPSWFRYELVWNKERGTNFLQANVMPMRSHEMVYVFSK